MAEAGTCASCADVGARGVMLKMMGAEVRLRWYRRRNQDAGTGMKESRTVVSVPGLPAVVNARPAMFRL
jgi:hypothetical protein